MSGDANNNNNNNAITKGIILVGGPSKGTKFRPLSLYHPKPLFPIAGIPMINHHLIALSRVPSMREIFVFGTFESSVFSKNLGVIETQLGIPIKYLQEPGSLKTGGGLFHFKDQILDTENPGTKINFFVIHVDICCAFPLEAMLKAHNETAAICTILGKKIQKEISTKFGCIVFNDQATSNQVLHFVEKPDSFLSDVINCGVYLFSSEFFQAITPELIKRRQEVIGYQLQIEEKENPTLNDEFVDRSSINGSETQENSFKTSTTKPESRFQFSLEVEVLPLLAENGSLFVYQTEDFWCQIKTCGSPITANRFFLQYYKDNRKSFEGLLSRCCFKSEASERVQDFSLSHLSSICGGSSSSTFQTTSTVFIHPSSKVHSSAILGPNVSVGEGCVIGAGVRIKDSILLPCVVIQDFAFVNNSVIGWNCRVGSWSRIEGSPETPHEALELTKNGIKRPSITILGGDIFVATETVIRNCIVLPHKELFCSYHNEIIL